MKIDTLMKADAENAANNVIEILKKAGHFKSCSGTEWEKKVIKDALIEFAARSMTTDEQQLVIYEEILYEYETYLNIPIHGTNGLQEKIEQLRVQIKELRLKMGEK